MEWSFCYNCGDNFHAHEAIHEDGNVFCSKKCVGNYRIDKTKGVKEMACNVFCYHCGKNVRSDDAVKKGRIWFCTSTCADEEESEALARIEPPNEQRLGNGGVPMRQGVNYSVEREKVVGLLAMLPELTALTFREAYAIINSVDVKMSLRAAWEELRALQEPLKGNTDKK